jgi:tetratricopeptide (TPR) repeat protein
MARGITKLDITKISTKDIEEAIKDFDHAIEIDPTLAEAHFRLGIAKSKLKDNKSAIESFDRAIEIDPTLAKAYFKRAIAQHSLNPEKAVKDYSEVLKFNHNSFTARHQRARLYCELKEYLKAIEDYDYIIKNHDNLMMFDPIYEDLMTTNPFPHLHNFYINRGKAKFHLNDYQEAIKDFTHILEELYPDDDSDASYYYELAKSRLAS